MEFKTGIPIKPLRTGADGIVVFTDGTNEVIPNQLQCEAYGYKYDTTSDSCIAFTPNLKLPINASNMNNFIKGTNNNTELGTNNTFIGTFCCDAADTAANVTAVGHNIAFIMGENNRIRGLSRNNIVIGSSNEISNGVNNATVLGNYGLAQRDGEVVIGGGAFEGSKAGSGQSSIITLSGTTTDATQTNLKVNNSASNTIIARGSTSSFQGFEANVIGVRTGGSAGSGAVNDRIFLRLIGLVFLKDLQGGTARTQAASGTTTGWTSAMTFSGTNDMHLSVTGVADMNISWSATLRLYEITV